MDRIVRIGEASIRIGAVVSIAEAAGAKIMEIYSSANPTDWEVTCKSDESPLTKADLESNREICAQLEQLTPKLPIMSEENKQVNYEKRKEWGHYWCVDPLDGTKEFVKRNGEFTVNIALMKGGVPGAHPILGVVYAPAKKRVYFAGKSVGAYTIPDWNDRSVTKRIYCAEFAESDAGLTIVCSRSHLDDMTRAFMAKYKDTKTSSMGSSLKFMLVAEGAAHIYPRLAPTMEWDTAASQIIVEEAGGQVLFAATKLKMYYNRPNLKNPHFICYGKRNESNSPSG